MNAGKSTIKGIGSASAISSAVSRGTLDHVPQDLAEDIVIPPVPVGGPYSAFLPTAVAGGPLALSPKHRLTLTGTYTLPVPESIGEVRLS